MAAPAGPPVRAVPFPGKAKLRGDIQNYLRTRPGKAAVMVDDLATGMSFGYRQQARFVAASVMKVDVVTALLLRRQQRPHGLSEAERSLVTRMLRLSDNAAADEVYRAIGRGPALNQTNRRLGLRDTRAYPTAWGASETSAADQVRLMRVLTSANSPVSGTGRRLVLGLMESVAPGQAWGVSAAARHGEGVAVKNGWTPLEHQGTGWAVHSIGRIRGRGHDFLVAVLSAGSPGEGAGIATVEQLSRLAVSALRHP